MDDPFHLCSKGDLTRQSPLLPRPKEHERSKTLRYSSLYRIVSIAFGQKPFGPDLPGGEKLQTVKYGGTPDPVLAKPFGQYWVAQPTAVVLAHTIWLK